MVVVVVKIKYDKERREWKKMRMTLVKRKAIERFNYIG